MCWVIVWLWSFFFFQAEDGIRDYKVTGVQTCALPISPWSVESSSMTVSWNSPFSSYIDGRANTKTCKPSVGVGSRKFCLANMTQRTCAVLSRSEKYQWPLRQAL